MDSGTIRKEYINSGSELTSIADLEQLADSSSPAVRRRVAENRRTTIECLSKLVRDSSAEVRAAVALNKSTPEAILAVLASDENSDVRYRLASTSYAPKHLLRQLSADANPHVSQRAKVMLSGLESKVGRMVTVFEFLSEDHGMLASKLRVLVEKYPQWSRDKIFDETVDLFDGIMRHLERQQTLCLDWMEHHVQESGSIKRVVVKSSSERKEIQGQISDLLMQHVDGPDFLTSLGQLVERLQAHIEFAESELFSELKKQLPPEELDQVNLRLNQSILRGESI